MTEAVFMKRRPWSFVLIALVALAYIVLGVYTFWRRPGAQGAVALLTFLLVMGVLWLVLAVLIFLLNRNAFLRVDEKMIVARFHFGTRVSLPLEDVIYAFSQGNSLIFVDKGKKVYRVMGVLNSFEICGIILSRIPFFAEEAPATLFERARRQNAVYKRRIVLIFAGIILMFALALFTEFLTDWKETEFFTDKDWFLFAVMCVAEVACCVWLFVTAVPMGKRYMMIAYTSYMLKRHIIETYPLPSGNVKRVLTDPTFSSRVIVFDALSCEAMYYCVEHFDSPYTLHCVYTSSHYKTEESLNEALTLYMDITSRMRKD